MYGMLMESIQHFVQLKYGEQAWKEILIAIGMKNVVFSTHKIYSETVVPNIANCCSRMYPSKSADDFKRFFGVCFVKFWSHYGYDKLARSTGRYFRDFVHGIDNLHNQIRFTYPRMSSPFFHVEQEHQYGMTLHYRTSRKGYATYVIGQFETVAKAIYGINLIAEICGEPSIDPIDHTLTLVVIDLRFDNSVYTDKMEMQRTIPRALLPSLSSYYIFRVLPFAVAFDRDMKITTSGKNFEGMFGGGSTSGRRITDLLHIRRPRIKFSFNQVMFMREISFELQSIKPVFFQNNHNRFTKNVKNCKCIKEEYLLLKGEMKLIEEWDNIIYLCSPLLADIKDLCDLGLCLTDLGYYGLCRDIAMAKWQHGGCMEVTYEKLEKRSKELENSFHELDEWKTKGDRLLRSMIPESIAKQLSAGQDPMSLAKTFQDVTVLFAEIIGYTQMYTKSSPLSVVEGINAIYTQLDNVLDNHKVYKVETVGSAIYMVVGGVPETCKDHAENVADVAIEMIQTMHRNPVKIGGIAVEARIGVHSGPVAAGVVGLKNLRYNILGDTVNTASRMQSNSLPGRILTSERTKMKISNFTTVFNRIVNVKGKGEMKTYWILKRKPVALEIFENSIS